MEEKSDKPILIKRVPHMKENGKEVSEMDTAYKNGQMDLIMKVCGILELLMGMVNSISATDTNIKATG